MVLAYVGGYSKLDRNGRARGITAWQVGAADAPWTLLDNSVLQQSIAAAR